LLLTRGPVTVVQGGRPSLIRFSFGRLEFQLRPLVGFRTAWYGFFAHDETVSRGKRVVITAAGPAVSLLAFLTLSTLAGGLSYPASWFVGSLSIFAAVQFLVTALPLRYGRFFGPYAGLVSDGRRILDALRASRA
jgi:hypothetical protein